jgi:hypothetical protein
MIHPLRRNVKVLLQISGTGVVRGKVSGYSVALARART